MSETIAASDNLAEVKYDSGQVHVYEVDENGKKTHISHDKALEDRGYDPADSAANYALKNQEVQPNPEDDPLGAINKRFDELERRQKEYEDNAERRHRETIDAINNLADAIRGSRDPANPNLPPGARVGPPEDEGMDRMRTHFSMLDGDNEGEEPREPLEPSPAERLKDAEKSLEDARNQLVIYTIRRRARAGDGLTDSRREDKELYDQAMANYKSAIQAYLRVFGEDLAANHPEMAEEAIQREQLSARYQEMLKFKEAEHNKNEELLNTEVEAGGWRRLKARALRRWANYSTGKKILIGVAVGGGAALASGTLGLGLAAVAAGTAVKFSLGLLNRSVSARNISEKSYEREVARLEQDLQRSLLEFDRVTARGPLESAGFIAGQAESVEEGLDKDVSRSQWRNRVGNALLLLGASSTAYGAAHLAGDHLPDFRLWPGTGPEHHPTAFSLKGIGADQIHARTPTEFQHGVLGLLHREGVRVHGATPERIREMTQWMETHHIASGMARGPHGLEQNLTYFPHPGQEFANAHASAEQGFRIGADGTGTHALDQWIRHAQKIGMKFERVKK